MDELLDALGNPIVIGNTYGYTSSENGFSKVTIGKAVKCTPKGKVTLATIKSTRFLYGKKIEDAPATEWSVPSVAKTSTSVTSHMVFPVQ